MSFCITIVAIKAKWQIRDVEIRNQWKLRECFFQMAMKKIVDSERIMPLV